MSSFYSRRSRGPCFVVGVGICAVVVFDLADIAAIDIIIVVFVVHCIIVVVFVYNSAYNKDAFSINDSDDCDVVIPVDEANDNKFTILLSLPSLTSLALN